MASTRFTVMCLKRFLSLACFLVFLVPLCVQGGENDDAALLYKRAIEKLYGKKLLNVLPAEDPDGAIRLFERIIDNYPSSEYAPLAELGIAEAYLRKSDPYMAIEKFKEFIERRPGHPRYPYALCKIAEAYQSLLSSIDRDLTPAENALFYLRELKVKYPTYTECGDVDKKITRLRSVLASREVYVARFYLKRGNILAARIRLRGVIENYSDTPLKKEAEKLLREIEKKLARVK